MLVHHSPNPFHTVVDVNQHMHTEFMWQFQFLLKIVRVEVLKFINVIFDW
jgi:hypothetical protein